jgi:hypothetical protein
MANILTQDQQRIEQLESQVQSLLEVTDKQDKVINDLIASHVSMKSNIDNLKFILRGNGFDLFDK